MRPGWVFGMDTRLSATAYLDHLAAEGAALSAAARRDLTAPVPTCPGWTVLDVVEHTAEVYHHKLVTVEQRLSAPPTEWEKSPGDRDPVDWYDASLDRLLAALRAADPATPVWTWYGPEQDAGFWRRRMAHEALIHRTDAEVAFGPISAAPADLAADGADEILDCMLVYGLQFADEPVVPGAGETVRLNATDTGHSWSLRLDADSIDLRREGDEADCTVSGTASDLDFYLWGRLPEEALDISGAPAVAHRLRELLTVATQ